MLCSSLSGDIQMEMEKKKKKKRKEKENHCCDLFNYFHLIMIS